MKGKQKLTIGIILSIIGLALLGFHLIQYIDLIERINVLLSLLGEEGIDTMGIIFEVFLGFFIMILGLISLASLYNKDTRKEEPFIVQEFKEIPAQKILYCQNCGEKALPSTRFCKKCGEDISL